MTISLPEFISRLSGDPVLRITVLLILGVIMVNGWTDAPNAIATVVATGGMKLGAAVRMAAVCNFAGLFFLSAVNTQVAFTVYHIADFGGNGKEALAALCAALSSIILWSAGIHGAEWGKVLCGLAVSVALGFAFGWLGGKLARWTEARFIVGKSTDGRYPAAGGKHGKSITKAQICGAAAMAFMHGAQDGQKFMGVFLLGVFLAQGSAVPGSFSVPFWMMLLCSAVMAAGTMIGGERIIRTVGNEMVRLERIQGAAADGAAAVCLLLCSLLGIPVSTTHVKTTAVMGVGRAGGKGAVNRDIVGEMFLAWVITFPCCGLIGYLTAGVFLSAIRNC